MQFLLFISTLVLFVSADCPAGQSYLDNPGTGHVWCGGDADNIYACLDTKFGVGGGRTPENIQACAAEKGVAGRRRR